MRSQKSGAGNDLQLLLLLKGGKLQIQKSSVNSTNVEAGMGSGIGDGKINAHRGDLPRRSCTLRLGKIPFHAKLTQAFFIYRNDMRFQLHLSDGQIHLFYPVLKVIKHRRNIAHQQSIRAFVD
ncbi:hypothetical protein D3C80_932300 [compost metagenome]